MAAVLSSNVAPPPISYLHEDLFGIDELLYKIRNLFCMLNQLCVG